MSLENGSNCPQCGFETNQAYGTRQCPCGCSWNEHGIIRSGRMSPRKKENVLISHNPLGHISVMQQHAVALGYPFFLWNDRVYSTSCGTDMNLTVEDLR